MNGSLTDNSSTKPGREAIILAGGLGTRLRSVVSELPKCMAPVAGRPFLFHVVNYLRLEGIEKFVFSLGYKHELIEQYLSDQFPTLQYKCSVESEPLGTGGAIQLALSHCTSEDVLIANGDTLFKASLDRLYETHRKNKSACTLALKPMQGFDRYGVVEINDRNVVTAFHEKKYYDSGMINGGLYILNVKSFREKHLPSHFSFEKDFLEKFHSDGNFHGISDDGYFIDIGIPEDFRRADQELKLPPLNLQQIDRQWTLFLDRDGVINHDKIGSYIFHPGEFRFYDGVPEAMKILSEKFGRLIITTNQRGVGRGMMTLADLHQVHEKMENGIQNKGGKLDAIFFASSIANTDLLRKPNPGMAIAAKRKFPGIDFQRSVMIGNNVSDMQFGRNTGTYTVFLTTTQPIQLPNPDIDLVFDSLPDFAKAL